MNLSRVGAKIDWGISRQFISCSISPVHWAWSVRCCVLPLLWIRLLWHARGNHSQTLPSLTTSILFVLMQSSCQILFGWFILPALETAQEWSKKPSTPLALSTRQDQSFPWQPGETHTKQKTEIIFPLFTVLLTYLSLLYQNLDRGTRLQGATTSQLK